MADAYNVVRSHHAALADLTEARLAADRAASRAEARAAAADVAAAERVAAGTRAAVNAALREGRITSDAAILDMPNDCIDCIVALLSPKEAARASGACRALRDAVVRAGTPSAIGEVGVENRRNRSIRHPDVQGLVERLRRCSPALGVRRLTFCGCSFDDARDAARHAALLGAVLNSAPRVTRVDVDVGVGDRAAVEAIADVLLARADRGFELGLKDLLCDEGAGTPLRRIAEGGIPVVSLGIWFGNEALALAATSRTLTSLSFTSVEGVLPRLPRLPQLRRLKLITDSAFQLSTGQALTSVTPRLNEIVIVGTTNFDLFPPLFRVGEHAFWSSIARSLTRLTLKPIYISNRIDWGLSALTALRELSIYAERVAIATDDDSGVRVDLPQLAPSVTRLTASGSVRFRQPTASVLPGLLVLDQHLAETRVSRVIVDDLEEDVGVETVVHQVTVPLVLPPAAATPRLTTLLLGYTSYAGPATVLDLASLLAAPRPTLTTFVFEYGHLTCSTEPRDLEARVRAALPALRCVHLHSCSVDHNAAAATDAFIAALGRSARVCRANAGVCMFCRLFDGEEEVDDNPIED